MTMGPMTIRVKTGAQHLSLVIISSVSLATAAHAQGFTNGIDTGIGGSGNLGFAPGSPATLLTYGVDAGIGESDNVTLVPTNKISQTICSMSLRKAISAILITCRVPMATN
jgi:hypothetical protein